MIYILLELLHWEFSLCRISTPKYHWMRSNDPIDWFIDRFLLSYLKTDHIWFLFFNVFDSLIIQPCTNSIDIPRNNFYRCFFSFCCLSIRTFQGHWFAWRKIGAWLIIDLLCTLISNARWNTFDRLNIQIHSKWTEGRWKKKKWEKDKMHFDYFSSICDFFLWWFFFTRDGNLIDFISFLSFWHWHRWYNKENNLSWNESQFKCISVHLFCVVGLMRVKRISVVQRNHFTR